LTWLPLALLAAVFLVVSAMRERQADELDYAALCREAQAPVATPEQVLAIDARIDAVFLAAEGNHRPTSAELPMFRASALLGAEAETAGAPYRLPADLRGSLPAMPDLTKVRALQSELAAACR
jgi:hypothetical protein